MTNLWSKFFLGLSYSFRGKHGQLQTKFKTSDTCQSHTNAQCYFSFAFLVTVSDAVNSLSSSSAVDEDELPAGWVTGGVLGQ